MNGIEIGLAIVCMIVVAGSPVLFSVKARPLGDLPYRWGTFVGICAILLSVGLVGSAIRTTEDSRSPIAAVFALVEFAAAIGVLRRKRWGVVLLLSLHTFLILLAALSQDIEAQLTPSQVVAYLTGIGINVWYFGRRWHLMGACGPGHDVDAGAASADPLSAPDQGTMSPGEVGDTGKQNESVGTQ